MYRPVRSESARRPGIWNTVDILCGLDPVRKLEAGFEHPPGLRLKPCPIDGTVDTPSSTVVVELVHPYFREIPGLLPYLVLLAHDRAREPHQRAPWRGTPARRMTCALSPGWSSPARCWCAGASSGSAGSRGRSARRARPPPAPPPPSGSTPPACRTPRGT